MSKALGMFPDINNTKKKKKSIPLIAVSCPIVFSVVTACVARNL